MIRKRVLFRSTKKASPCAAASSDIRLCDGRVIVGNCKQQLTFVLKAVGFIMVKDDNWPENGTIEKGLCHKSFLSNLIFCHDVVNNFLSLLFGRESRFEKNRF